MCIRDSSVRLWKLLSEAGFPTVLVDVDLRKSELQKKYEVEGIEEGLNHFLSGLAEYEDVVYETNIPNGHIVPVTTLLEHPSALLEDPRLGELLDRLAEDYRYVIICLLYTSYNFPQGRVTDHRIKLTLHRLDDILNGDLDEIIDSLTAADQAAKLSKLQEMER